MQTRFQFFGFPGRQVGNRSPGISKHWGGPTYGNQNSRQCWHVEMELSQLQTFLSVLVIPLLLWGVKLEVGQAVQDEKIERLESEVAAAKAIKDGVTANTTSLGRVEEKLDATNRRLDDIRSDLRRSLPPR